MMIGEQRDFIGYGYRCPSCDYRSSIKQMRISANAYVDASTSIEIRLPSLADLKSNRSVFQATCPKCHTAMHIYDEIIDTAKIVLENVIDGRDWHDKFVLKEGHAARGSGIIYPTLTFASSAQIQTHQYGEVDKPSSTIMDGPYFIKMKVMTAERRHVVNYCSDEAYDAETVAIAPLNQFIPNSIPTDASDAVMDDADLLIRDTTLRLVLMAVRAYIDANHIEVTDYVAVKMLELMQCCCGIEAGIIRNFEMRKILNMK